MQCGKCGEPVPGGAHFCGSCGARIDTPAPLLGQTIAGRYRLVRQVGEGGMGSVFEAEQTLGSSQRAVAVKLLRPEWSHDPAVKARFHREAATVARLEHFNTVRVYDFGATDDGTLFIVMEFLQGRSLQQLLDQGGALPPERVEHIAQQIAASLEEAHGLGIVHRDLKPDNILLIDNYASQRDVVKIVDFGIAKGQPALGAATTKLTELGAFVGTPAYMSPEQFSPGGVGPESDIYSLGLTTYQMLAGHLPFAAQTTLEWAYAHTSKPPQPLDDQYGAGPIPEAMRHAVLRALAKDPAQRQTTATMFSHELSGRTVREAQPVAASAASAPLAASSGALGSAPAGSAPAGSAPAGQAPAQSAAFEPARAEKTDGAPAAGGGPRTAPMMQFPDLGAPAGRPPTTQPMAAVPEAAPRREPVFFGGVPAAPPVEERSRPGRVLLWATVALGGTTTVLLLAWAVWNQGLLPWPQLGGAPDVAPPPLVVPASGSPAEPEPAPSAPDPLPEATRPEPAPPKEPSAPRPTPRPPAKPPAPEPAPAAPASPAPAPTSPLPLPGLPGQPAPTLPGQPAPGTPEPAPSTPPATVPGVPQLPWSLPTAGSCERCLQALQAGGNYAVVTAVGESLLCEDRTARATCEKQIDEQAPAIAERAARAGDCPAAIATVAAAVNVRVSPDRFRNIDALCGLR